MMLDQSRDFRSRRRRIVDRAEEGMGPTRNGRTNVEHLHAIAARGDPRLLGEVRAHFQRARNLSAEVKFPWRDRAPWRGAETGGATMNKAVMKLPLMLGVVGAIAFAAATPSWAAEQKGPNAADGGNAQAAAQAKTTQAKTTGSAAKTSARTNTGAEMSTGHAASNEGMAAGKKLSKSSQLSGRTHMGPGRKHLSSKEGVRTRTHIGSRENVRTRTSVGLREARLRNRNIATSSVGFGVDAGFQDTGFAYGYGSPGYGYGAGYPGYQGYGYAARYPGRCTCAPGVASGYGSPAYDAAYGWGGWGWGAGWGPGYASWGWGGTEAGFGVTATGTSVGVSSRSRVRGARVSANTTGGAQAGMTTQPGMTAQTQPGVSGQPGGAKVKASTGAAGTK